MKNAEIFLVFFILSVSVFTSKAHENCQEFLSIEKSSGSKRKISIKNTLKPPIKVKFSHKVENVEVNTNSTLIKQISDNEIELENNSTNQNPETIFLTFKLQNPNAHLHVTSIEKNGDKLCGVEERDDLILPGPCGVRATLDRRPSKILQKLAAWSTGRNYRLAIPSLPTFVGYVVDIFFTKPITELNVADAAINTIKFSPTHWALVKRWTDNACIKLVDVFFTVAYRELSDVNGLLLNNKTLIGEGYSTAMYKNTDYTNAVKKDCESLLHKRGDPWFGPTEKARPLWFETTLESRPQFGVVIDFIFQENIQELRLWELKAEKIHDYHWRVSNPGIMINETGKIRFPLALYFHKHYHVPLIGVKVNDQVVCGLRKPTYIPVDTSGSTETVSKLKSEKVFQNLDSSLKIQLTLNSLTILLCILAALFLLTRMTQRILLKRRHLYDFPASSMSPSNISNITDDTYASIEKDTPFGT